MEFVRSSYFGQWKLDPNNPQTITRGRYIRVPQDTPHFPEPHNFWSNNWVDDQYSKPDEPLLGDVTPIKGRKWFNGVSLVPLPPSDINGCATGIPVSSRSIVGGFDSRCWTAKGIPVPDNIPIVWYRGDSFRDALPNGQPPLWRDMSNYKHDAIWNPPGQFNYSADIDGFPAVSCNASQSMAINTALQLCPRWTAFAAMQVNTNSGVFPVNCGIFARNNSDMLLLVLRNSVWFLHGTHGVQFPTDDNADKFIIWSIRRNGLFVNVWRNDVDLGFRTGDLELSVQGVTLATPLAQFPHFPPPLPSPTAAWLFEAILYNEYIRLGQFDTIRNQLLAYYAGLLPSGVYFPGTYFPKTFFPETYWK